MKTSERIFLLADSFSEEAELRLLHTVAHLGFIVDNGIN
jgi:hypothetical protein